jgi:hypothetical protein
MSKKIQKSFREHLDENIRERPLKKESRNNFKKHLQDVIENEDWDEFEDELSEQSRIRRR